MKLKYLIFSVLLLFNKIFSVSIVYHFRIAQITKQPIYGHIDNHNLAIALFFDQVMKRYSGDILKNFSGNLNAFIYNFKSYYLRGDFAYAYVMETIKKKLEFSGMETDDILLTFGRNFHINDRAKITVSGLFGFPTHKNYHLQHVQLAYAQVGLGAQIDGIYKLKEKDTFIWGVRALYFVPRNALDDCNKNHKFTVGTLSDILIAYKHDLLNSDIEFGLTERFQLGARIFPSLDHAVHNS